MHKPMNDSGPEKFLPAKSTVLNDEKPSEKPSEKSKPIPRNTPESQKKPKLRSEHIPGPNAKDMIESISSKIGKGPIPEKSDSIPIRPIHQVPIHSVIGRAIEDLGNLSHKAKVSGKPDKPDGDSSSSDSDSSSSTDNNAESVRHKHQKSKSKK